MYFSWFSFLCFSVFLLEKFVKWIEALSWLTGTAYQNPLTVEGAAQIEDVIILFPRSKSLLVLCLQ